MTVDYSGIGSVPAPVPRIRLHHRAQRFKIHKSVSRERRDDGASLAAQFAHKNATLEAQVNQLTAQINNMTVHPHNSQQRDVDFQNRIALEAAKAVSVESE